MNLRQKAKKYKRELEMIKGRPMPVAVVTPIELRHLRIKKNIDPEFEYYCYKEKTGEDYINEMVAKGLIDRLKYYVVHDRIDNTYSLDVWVMEGE
jgi:hypothetical protein